MVECHVKRLERFVGVPLVEPESNVDGEERCQGDENDGDVVGFETLWNLVVIKALDVCKSLAETIKLPCFLNSTSSSAMSVRFEVGKSCWMSHSHEWWQISNCDLWLVSGWITCNLRYNLHPGLTVIDEIGLMKIVLCDFAHCITEENVWGVDTSHCEGPVWKTCSFVSPSSNWQFFECSR